MWKQLIRLSRIIQHVAGDMEQHVESFKPQADILYIATDEIDRLADLVREQPVTDS